MPQLQRLGAALCAGLMLVPFSVAAQPLTLAMPGPNQTTATRSEPMTSFRLPIGPFTGGNLTLQDTAGALEQTAWKIDSPGLATLELMAPLKTQLEGMGFRPLFECDTEACGGYDFRFASDVLPEPDMHIDLGDFRYLAAERKGPTGPEYVALMVSRSSHEGFVQLTRIGGAQRQAPALTLSSKSPDIAPLALPALQPGPAPQGTDTLTSRLALGKPQALDDLVFPAGSSRLAAGEYPSLIALAAWLQADGARRITLVGHTDAEGSLPGNLTVSRARAESVRQALITLGAGAGQITAEGVGFLAPRATNQTAEGRAQNRRVEVITTSTLPVAP